VMEAEGQQRTKKKGRGVGEIPMGPDSLSPTLLADGSDVLREIRLCGSRETRVEEKSRKT